MYSPWLVDALEATSPWRPTSSPTAPAAADAGKTALAVLELDDASAQDVVQAGREATDAEQLDGATLELRLQATLLQHVTQEHLDKAAQTLGPATGDLFALTDLGYVSPEVGRASGFECTAEGTNAASGTTGEADTGRRRGAAGGPTRTPPVTVPTRRAVVLDRLRCCHGHLRVVYALQRRRAASTPLGVSASRARTIGANGQTIVGGNA